MNRYAFHHNSFAACEEMRGNAAACGSVEMNETIICPKPRRLGLIQTTTLYEPSYPRPLRWQASHYHQEAFDSKAGSELLDIIIAKQGGCATDQPVPQIASSPPFFSGSPPSRVSNPLTQDARFGDEKYTPISPRAIPTPTGLAPSPSSTRKGMGGCVRASFGNNPARRVEGFDCLDRDRRNCSIPALA